MANDKANDMTKADQRPPIWVGHVLLNTAKIEATETFMCGLGMRLVARDGNAIILELRGGTHLVLLEDEKAETGDVTFDLMVDDIEAAHQMVADLGGAPTEISENKIHKSFFATEPAGNKIKFFDSHVAEGNAV